MSDKIARVDNFFAHLPVIKPVSVIKCANCLEKFGFECF